MCIYFQSLGSPYFPASYGVPAIDTDDVNIPIEAETPESDIYRLYGFASIIPHLGIEELQSKAVMREAINRASSLIELIKALMDEWLTRAVVTGNDPIIHLRTF